MWLYQQDVHHSKQGRVIGGDKKREGNIPGGSAEAGKKEEGGGGVSHKRGRNDFIEKKKKVGVNMLGGKSGGGWRWQKKKQRGERGRLFCLGNVLNWKKGGEIRKFVRGGGGKNLKKNKTK